jgi:hypothetical protein
MGVHNRTFGNSEQKKALEFSSNVALSNGETGVLNYVPYPCILNAVNLAAFSNEGGVSLSLSVLRFCPTQGMTTITLVSGFVPVSYGVSGFASSGLSLPASGSTLLNLMQGDILGYQVGGGATAGIFGLAGCFVVQPTQDIKVFLGQP